MLKRIKTHILTILPVSTTKNIGWIFILKIFNMIIPYLTFPYIVRVLMPSGFGVFAFSLAFISYFQAVVEYGFNLTGARRISLVKDDKDEISKIFSSIMTTKFLLLFLSLLFIILSSLIFNQFRDYRLIIWIMTLTLIGYTLMPTWLYQGLQKMKMLTVFSVIYRVIFVVFVFVFIKDVNDVWIYSLLYGSSFFFIGISSLIFVHFKLKIKFRTVSIKMIMETLKDGFYVFTSSIIIRVSSMTGILLLGLFYSSTEVGLFSASLRLVTLITILFQPLSQALFPFFSSEFGNSFNQGYNNVIKIFKIILPVFLFGTFLLIILRDVIVTVILGADFYNAGMYLLVLSFLPILSIVSNMIGTQILVASGNTKRYSRAFLRSAVGYILSYTVLIYYFSIWGAVYATIIGELFSVSMLFIELNKLKKEVL